MKQNKPLPKRKTFIRKRMYNSPVPGSKTALLGSLILLIYVFSELLTRYDAVDGMWQAYFRLVAQGDITILRAIQNLFETPEARRDLIALVYLGTSGIVAFISCMSTKNWQFSFIMLMFSAFVACYNTSGNWLFAVLNITEYIKLTGCALLFAGSVFKIFSVRLRKKRAELEYNRKISNQRNNRKSTIIPKRIQTTSEKR